MAKHPSLKYISSKRSGLNPLASRLPKLLRTHASRQGFAEGDLLQRWQSICPEYAAYSYPASLRQGRLVVAVNSDSARQNMQYILPSLLQKLNGFYGYEAVKNIQLITRHFEPNHVEKVDEISPSLQAVQQAEKACQNIKNTDLKQALQKLGSFIYNKEK